MTRPTLSVLIPVYNEVGCLEPLLRELGAVLDGLPQSSEIVAVDDGSTDGSFDRLVALTAREPRLRVLRLARNYGQTAAIAAAIEHARGELLVSLDADLQNDPRDIPTLLAALRPDVDVVNGWRQDRKDPWLSRRLPSQIANRVISVVTGTALHDYGCTLRVMRASCGCTASCTASSRRSRPTSAPASSRCRCRTARARSGRRSTASRARCA
jgi:glycosyltransferase involved in cell wall biosynthesis